jgi:hypothetical protein
MWSDTYTPKIFAHKIALHGFAPWTSIAAQVLDGPPGDATRRLSTFLLIPVGFNWQGFAYGPLTDRSDVSSRSRLCECRNWARNA